MNKRGAIYGVLILLTLFSWRGLQLNKPEPVVKNKKSAHYPDFFSTGYTKIELNEQGQYKNKIVASRLTHFPGDDSYQLENPVMSTYDDDQLDWKLSAKKGWLSADNNDLLLRGDVVVTRRQSADSRAIRLNTSNLLFKPKQNYAETDDKVVIIMPPHVTEGVGMQLYFKQPIHLKLLTNVKGKYVLQ